MATQMECFAELMWSIIFRDGFALQNWFGQLLKLLSSGQCSQHDSSEPITNITSLTGRRFIRYWNKMRNTLSTAIIIGTAKIKYFNITKSITNFWVRITIELSVINPWDVQGHSSAYMRFLYRTNYTRCTMCTAHVNRNAIEAALA